MISWKQSKKILKLLAAISSKQHARAIVKRNTEAFETGGSYIPCPHCSCEEAIHSCKDCLWVYAIRKVTGKPAPSRSMCPCLYVTFVKGKGWRGDNIYVGAAYLEISDPDDSFVKAWIKAHIKWAKNLKKWGTQKPPRGFRTKVAR